MTIMIYITVAILILFITYTFATDRCRTKFEQKMTTCCKEYDRKIENFTFIVKKLSADCKKFQSDYETVLNGKKDYQARYYDMIKQKAQAESHAVKLQTELFCARKRIKKHLGSKQN